MKELCFKRKKKEKRTTTSGCAQAAQNQTMANAWLRSLRKTELIDLAEHIGLKKYVA